MDFATIAGVVIGTYLVVFWGIGDPMKIALFIDIPSVAITIGGSIAALMVAYPFSTLAGVGSAIKKTLINRRADRIATIKSLVHLSEVSRKEGLLSLEGRLPQIPDEFMRRNLQLLIDGTDATDMEKLMDAEIEALDHRHRAMAQIFDDFASLTPAFGMIGTLVGLVLMLANMNDPSTIGPAMAMALITTFYGALIANLFLIPMAIKLKNYNNDEVHHRLLIKDGMMALQNGMNPRYVQSRLMVYLNPTERLRVEQVADKQGGKRG